MKIPVRIALVDDHRLFRHEVASLINDFEGYTVVFEAADGLEMTRKIDPESKPHIILLDIHMRGMNGTDSACWLRENHPGIAVIVLSMSEDADLVLTMVRMGVKGYLLKDVDPWEFKAALDQVSHKGLYYPEFVSRHLASGCNPALNPTPQNSREITFLKLAATEYTYKEIADRMCVSIRTVDGYRDQLLEKLCAKNRTGLVLYSIKHHLIEL